MKLMLAGEGNAEGVRAEFMNASKGLLLQSKLSKPWNRMSVGRMRQKEDVESRPVPSAPASIRSLCTSFTLWRVCLRRSVVACRFVS